LPPGDETLLAGGKFWMIASVAMASRANHRANSERASIHQYHNSHEAATKYSEGEILAVKHGIRRTGMAAPAAFYTDRQYGPLRRLLCTNAELPPAVTKVNTPIALDNSINVSRPFWALGLVSIP
jgi:hypothetical protein